jgi:5-methylcytosine-specific restriction enzyme subunit McrC
MVDTNQLPPEPIACAEYEAVNIPINYLLGHDGRLQLNSEIEKGDYFSVSLRHGVLTLRTSGYVGYIPLTNQVVIYVRPRVPVINLNRMAEIAGTPRITLAWLREYDLSGPWSESYADLYASALAAHVENIAANGLLRDYLRKEENSSFPRGRILIGPTVQSFSARGQYHKAVSTYFVRTADNPANRCLKYAMWLMGSHYAKASVRRRKSRLIQQRLNAAYSSFDGVSLDQAQRFVADPFVAGLRSLPAHRGYYREALDVALAITRQQGLLLDANIRGDVRLPSLILNMSDLFESYVRTVLQQHSIENRWTWQVLDGNAEGSRPLYKGQSLVKATPDIVIQDPGSARSVVVEVKYIPVADRSLREAVNQVVTYAACYETNRAVLVHPCDEGQASGIRKIGNVGQVEVFQYLYNLANADLTLEASLFGHAISALL